MRGFALNESMRLRHICDRYVLLNISNNDLFEISKNLAFIFEDVEKTGHGFEKNILKFLEKSDFLDEEKKEFLSTLKNENIIIINNE